MVGYRDPSGGASYSITGTQLVVGYRGPGGAVTQLPPYRDPVVGYRDPGGGQSLNYMQGPSGRLQRHCIGGQLLNYREAMVGYRGPGGATYSITGTQWLATGAQGGQLLKYKLTALQGPSGRLQGPGVGGQLLNYRDPCSGRLQPTGAQGGQLLKYSLAGTQWLATGTRGGQLHVLNCSLTGTQ